MSDENLPEVIPEEETEKEYQLILEDPATFMQFKAIIKAKNITEIKEKIANNTLIGAFAVIKTIDIPSE